MKSVGDTIKLNERNLDYGICSCGNRIFRYSIYYNLVEETMSKWQVNPDGTSKEISGKTSQLHPYPHKMMLCPQGSMESGSISLDIANTLSYIWNSWTDPKYKDSLSEAHAAYYLIANLRTEMDCAMDDFFDRIAEKSKDDAEVIGDIAVICHELFKNPSDLPKFVQPEDNDESHDDTLPG